ncbi:hypothetical protein L1887_07620 [Cichorium endivia]|nr:hypothetical protein L1887_07620 [Cichorium endivia]
MISSTSPHNTNNLISDVLVIFSCHILLTNKTWLNLQRNPSTINQKTGLRHFKNHLKSLLNRLKNQIPPYLKMLYQFILKTMSLTSQEVGRVH